MKSIVWCINVVLILFCSIAYADQRTVVSFDDLPLLPLLADKNQLRFANNDNPDYKGVVWDDGITVFGENYKICADCPFFGDPRSGSYAITNHDDLGGITLTTSKILLGFWAGQNEYYGYGGGSKQIIVHALDADGKSLQSVSFDLPDSLQGLAEPLSYVDTSVFLTCSAIIQGYRIEKSQSCTSDCNWVADDFTFTEKDVTNDEKLYTQAEFDAKYEAGKQYCIDNPEKCGIKVSSVDGCAILQNNLDIIMPCIDVFGTKLPIGLQKFTNTTDPSGYYWKLNLQ